MQSLTDRQFPLGLETISFQKLRSVTFAPLCHPYDAKGLETKWLYVPKELESHNPMHNQEHSKEYP